MRHKKSGRKLNRNSAHRKALFKNLAIALIERDIIKTTLPKAKELRRFIEPLITIGKNDTVANRRHVFNKLRSWFWRNSHRKNITIWLNFFFWFRKIIFIFDIFS